MTSFIPLILFTIATNFLSQISLKHGMTIIPKFDLNAAGIIGALPSVALNFYVIAGLALMVVSMGSHLIVLSRVEISFAYPFLGLSFVLTTLYGHYFLSESVGFWRVAGVAFIICGVAMVAKSG